jgi:hypothetical protein
MRHFADDWPLTPRGALSPHLETLTLRSLTLTGAAFLAVALMTGCEAGSDLTAETAPGLTADAADVFNSGKVVESFTETGVNPCNGEEIEFSGVAITRIILVDGGEHVILQSSSYSTGTGLESGATYTSRGGFHESFNTPSETAPHLEFFANFNGRTISSIPELNFTAHFVNHGVLTASGDFKLTRNVDRVECQA